MVLAIVMTSAIIASPLATYYLAQYKVDWSQLSNVGQSYGPAAAILSGAALLTVLGTFSLQTHQTRLMAEHSIREAHLSLMRDAWENPELLASLELIPPEREQLARQFAFINANFMYMRMGLISGQISEAEVEEAAAHSFSTPAGIYYWQRIRAHVERHFESSFSDALSKGYARATTAPEGFFLDEDDSGEEYSESAALQYRDRNMDAMNGRIDRNSN